MTRKPDFFLVGAAKSGTTSLYEYLKQHPQIFMCSPKEPHFFGEFRSAQPPSTQDAYLRLFCDAAPAEKAGEASTSYLYSTSACDQIATFNPAAKILILLRNPIDRAYSDYWHKRRTGSEPLSFEAALEAESRRVAAGWDYGFHYVRCGLYCNQVRRFFEAFGRQAVRVLLFDDLRDDAHAVCRDVFEFLEVDASFPVNVAEIHNPGKMHVGKFGTHVHRLYRNRWINPLVQRTLPGPGRRWVRYWLEAISSQGRVTDMRQQTRWHLAERFRADIVMLERLIDRDLSAWLRTERDASITPGCSSVRAEAATPVAQSGSTIGKAK